MNYETLGNEKLCRQVLNISFSPAWLLPARGSPLGGGLRKECITPSLTQIHLPDNLHTGR